MANVRKSTVLKKKLMLESLAKCKGIISHACKIACITEKTHRDWYNNDNEYKETVDAIDLESTDNTISKLYELIEGVTVETTVKGESVVYTVPPNLGAIIYHLKCKGRKRCMLEDKSIDSIDKLTETVERFIIQA